MKWEEKVKSGRKENSDNLSKVKLLSILFNIFVGKKKKGNPHTDTIVWKGKSGYILEVSSYLKLNRDGS